MTVEEKAKAYDEALKKIRPLYERAKKEDCPIWSTYEYVFPELRESEDERIRKDLIDYLWGQKIYYESDEVKMGDSQKCRLMIDGIAYLEKQKERGPLTKEEEYELHRIIEFLEDETCPSEWISLLHDIYCLPYPKQKEPKPANNYFEWRNIVYYVLKEWLGIGQYMDMAPFNDIVKTLQEKYSLPKPSEWSEEDEEMLSGFLHKLEVCDLLSNKENAWIVRKLKSLRPQPKQEWSEEDRKMIDHLIEALPMWANGRIAMLPSQADEYVERLKSLRPSWKPSDEQMRPLAYAIEFFKHNKKYADETGSIKYLESLLNDLQTKL